MANIQGKPEYKDNMEELTREPATPEIFNKRYQILLNNDAYFMKSLSDMQEEGEELKKSVSDGKSAVASAITEMGVSTESDATFATMSSNIRKIIATLSRAANVIKATINGKNEVSLTVPKTVTTKSGSWNGATYTASIAHTSGYIDECTESQEVTLTTKAATTITPGKTEQTAVSSGSRLYFSGSLKVANLGGDAVASNVLKGKKFSSNNAGREVAGTMMALSMTRLLGNYQYRAYEGFSNGYSSSCSFSSAQVAGTPVYIRFYTSDAAKVCETSCTVGTSVTSNSWKFELSTTAIKITYVGSGADIYIQLMAYLPTYALGSGFVWYS